MTNPRHIFVLIGFLAQALTWESYILLAAIGGLWALAVTRFYHRLPLTLTTEAVALVVGCAASVIVSRALGRSAHFFLGDGLILLQFVRLMRPLSRREKLTSLIVACFHFGVLCTLAPNIRFVLLFTAALFFFPGALKEILHTAAPGELRTVIPDPLHIMLVPSARVCFWLLLGSAFAFMTFPRFTGTPLQLREGFTSQGSLLDSILDPRRGGRANSQQVLMQIEGDNLGYLRCMSLTETDGIRWWTDKRAPLLTLRFNGEDRVKRNKRFLHRRVFVKNAHYLGRVVPVDGKPVFVKQNFFSNPVMQNDIGETLEVHMMWTTGNNIYEYYIDTAGEPEVLRPDFRRRLTYHPQQSQVLHNWLEKVVAKGTNDLQKARLLAQYLRSNFTYQLGTPELKRLEPVDDFIFNRREGHCERFAATMALLLRMQGIPSRVVIGYVPTTRNFFSGRAQVRFRDAHSWTEGYFDDVGWVTFDATPGPPPGSGQSDFIDMLEALDFAWYSHVVNFNGFGQRRLIASSADLLANVPPQAWNWLLLGYVAALLVLLGERLCKNKRWTFFGRAPRARNAGARHYYDEMLQALSESGAAKSDDQTPFEFLDKLRGNSSPGYTHAQIVTESFCRSFYGEQELTPEQQLETESALREVKHECRASHATVHQSQGS